MLSPCFPQCANGHLMCASCLSHLLADARLKDESATCPNCRCEISKTACIRNLAVEKAISELPSECRFCCVRLPRSEVTTHERELCQERCVSSCRLHVSSQLTVGVTVALPCHVSVRVLCIDDSCWSGDLFCPWWCAPIVGYRVTQLEEWRVGDVFLVVYHQLININNGDLLVDGCLWGGDGIRRRERQHKSWTDIS